MRVLIVTLACFTATITVAVIRPDRAMTVASGLVGIFLGAVVEGSFPQTCKPKNGAHEVSSSERT